MNRFNAFLVVFAVLAGGRAYGDYQVGNADSAAAGQGGYASHGGDSYGSSGSGSYASSGAGGYASPSSGSYASPVGYSSGSAHGSPYAPAHNSYEPRQVPHAPGSAKSNTVTSSISYPQNKGEILIHRPAAIIVKRPPTKVLVNHPPLVVKPAPVVLHKPPAVVLRKVFVKQHPRPVKVEPVYVNVVKPPAEKYFVNEKNQQQLIGNAQLAAPSQYASAPGANAGHGGLDANLAGIAADLGHNQAGNAAANAGYQLLPGNQGLAALANIAGPGAYGAPNY